MSTKLRPASIGDGGQVRLPGYGALFTSAATGKRYEMERYDEDVTTLYVSRGIGLLVLSPGDHSGDDHW